MSLITALFSFSQAKDTPSQEEIIENNDIGEHEDTDVKVERTRVCDILNNQLQSPPVVVVHVSEIFFNSVKYNKDFRRTTKVVQVFRVPV